MKLIHAYCGFPLTRVPTLPICVTSISIRSPNCCIRSSVCCPLTSLIMCRGMVQVRVNLKPGACHTMSVTGYITHKRPPGRKSNIITSMERKEPESSSHGRTRSQQSVTEPLVAPEGAKQRRNDSYPHASVRFKLPDQTTTISPLSGHKSSVASPSVSDAEFDPDKAQSDSNENISSPNTSRYSNQRLEIRRLQQEVAALREVSGAFFSWNTTLQ